ncbi:MAG: response regulator [Undibacterium sp.]|nr:response regulator [Opitutaceae bacterium]
MNSATRKTVVIVDDEKSYADLLAQLLKDNVECSVHVFYRPAEALAAIPELKPGVIVTDYYMPEINGLDFIRQATVLLPETVFVLITGHNMSTSLDELANLPSLKGHLAKPFGWRQLAAEVLGVWPGGSPPKLRGSASLKV